MESLMGLMRSLSDILQGCMVSLGQHVGAPGYHVWIILGAWDQLGTTWDDMLSPKGSPKKPQRDHGLQQPVFYEGHEGDIDFDRIFTSR